MMCQMDSELEVLAQMSGIEFSHTYCPDIDGHLTKRKRSIEVEEIS